MIISCETLAYQWIIAEVFHSDEEFANTTCTCSSFVKLVCVANVFERHLFGNKKLVLQNDGLRNVNFQDLILRLIHAISFSEKHLSKELKN